MLRTSIAFSAALALAAPPVLAQGKDDLWEVQTQMSMPGMPAGMPGMAQTHQICADKDPKKAATQRPDTEKCKVGDYKQYPRARNNLGYAYYLAGRKADARREIEAAVRLDPAYEKARANLLLLDWTGGRP